LFPIVGAVIGEAVNAFPSGALEALVFPVARKKFRYIKLVGGLIGFVAGLVQLALVARVG